MANLLSRLIGAFQSDALAQAEERAAQAESQRDYLRMMVTYSGAVQTRVDEPWQSGTNTSIAGSAASGYMIPALRDRARNLEDTNLLACSTLDRTVENVCGLPTRIEPRTSSPAFNAAVRKWWKNWSGSTACDVRGMNTLGQIIRFLYRGKERDGDNGLLLSEQESYDNKLRPKVQIIEPERLVTPMSKQYRPLAGKGQIVDGVEMDQYGAPIRYWISQSQPGQIMEPAHADADDFIFIRNATRYGQTRGVTKFQGGFMLYGMIMGYLEAAVIASRVGASSAMISKKRDPTGARNALGTMNITNKDPRLQHTQSSTTEKWMDIQPGAINFMHLDEDLLAFNPSQPQQQLPDAIACFARFVGLKFGLTIEQVLLDFTRTTFSGGKMARNQALETAAIEQEDLYTNVIRRIYQWALSKAVKLGDIRVPAPDDFWAHEWIPSAHLSPQPDKDIAVAERAIALGVDARSYVASSLGYYFPDLCNKNRDDLKEMEGLPPNNGVNMPGITAGQTDPDADPNANPDDGTEDVERLKAEMDTYGVAVRAGAITPQVEDENNFRRRLGLPAMSGDAQAAWAKDKGTRRPITLTQPGTTAPQAPPTGTPADETPE